MVALRAADMFCGAGGSTTGAEKSGAVKVLFAINHWDAAIATHQANHPGIKHVCARVDAVNPHHDVPEIDLLMASPDCTHHSIARGGRPTEDHKRATGWHVVNWIEALRPKWVVVENVREYMDWGPLGVDGRPLKSKKGETFKAWVEAIRSYGYRVEWNLLNAADYGEATSRVRLFVICRRDNKRIPWPKATHVNKHRAAAEIIDFSKPAPSIFTRKRPLSPKTMKRIEVGLRKFCDPKITEPFIVKLRGTGTANSVSNPLDTITGGGNHYYLAQPRKTLADVKNLPDVDLKVKPFLVPNFGERKGQEPRSHSVKDPLPTVTGRGAGNLIMPFITDTAQGGKIRDCRRPLHTITTQHSQTLVVPFLTQYNGTGTANSVDEPLTTVTTRHRHGLALVKVMKELGIVDIGYRMLDEDELSAAMGFPRDYQFVSSRKKDRIRMIGNAVCPGVMEAICNTIAGGE